ncbi:MAG: protein kinase [Planctomycetota bacterium]
MSGAADEVREEPPDEESAEQDALNTVFRPAPGPAPDATLPPLPPRPDHGGGGPPTVADATLLPGPPPRSGSAPELSAGATTRDPWGELPAAPSGYYDTIQGDAPTVPPPLDGFLDTTSGEDATIPPEPAGDDDSGYAPGIPGSRPSASGPGSGPGSGTGSSSAASGSQGASGLRSKRAGPASAQLSPGSLYAGKYELLDEIARGGMGVVYRARQVDLNRTVALKVMLAGAYAGEDDRRRFLLEAEASARLKHPNIVPVFDIGEVDGNLYFTMDYVEGAPLSKRKQALDRPALLRVMTQVCAGVAYAHQRGIIHRDLKPGNVMMNAQDEPLIMDFGLAKQTELTDEEGRPDSRTREGQVMGTPHYMPPEQAEGLISEIDVRSDVWALGVMLYELWCGQLPFTGKSFSELMLKIFERDPTPPRQLDPTIDRDLEAIILKALEKQKERRYEGAAALQRDLEQLAAGLPISARRATPLYRLSKWVKRNRVGVLVGAAFLVVVSGLGGFGAHQYREGVRQRELVERERVDAVRRDYAAALGAAEVAHTRLAAAAAVHSGEVAALLGGGGEWRGRVAPAAAAVARGEALRRELEEAGRGLARFADAPELQPGMGPGAGTGRADAAEVARELRQERERQVALERSSRELEALLEGLADRVARLREAQALLEEITRPGGRAAALAAAEARAVDALRAAPSSGGSGTDAAQGPTLGRAQGRAWQDLAAALAHFDQHGMREAAGGVASVASASAFDLAERALSDAVVGVLARAGGDSPERAAAEGAMRTQQQRRMAVDRARQDVARQRLAAELEADAAGLLAALRASRSQRDLEARDQLRAARLVQALVSRGLEAAGEGAGPLRGRLQELRFDANRVYAEVLLDLRAWQIFRAELDNKESFRRGRERPEGGREPDDLAALEALYARALGQEEGLRQRLRGASAGLEGLSFDDLGLRVAALAELERDARGYPELLQRTVVALAEARRLRAARALSDANEALVRARHETDAVPLPERPRQLQRLGELWRAARGLIEARGEALGAERPPKLRACAEGLFALERDAALALERQDPREAAEHLAAARKALAELGQPSDPAGAQPQEPEDEELTRLARRLEQASGTPEGMVLIKGPLDVTLGGGPGDRNPAREVKVQPFYLALHEVTNRDYAAFLKERGEEVAAPRGWPSREPAPGTEDLPVTGITFAEAQAYAAARGMRLPWDREWEYAVRAAPEGLRGGDRVFPWAGAWREDALADRLRPPGSSELDKSQQGVLDLAGNVSEWVVFAAPKDGPRACARGASYLYPLARIAAAGHRLMPPEGYQGPQLGLRLAKDAPR